MRIHYNRNGHNCHYKDTDAKQSEKYHKVTAGRENMETYSCECLLSENGQWVYSGHSNQVHLNIQDHPIAPSISMDPFDGVVSVGQKVKITCQGEIRAKGGTFYLHRNKTEAPVLSRNTSGTEQTVIFTIDIGNSQTAGNYRCEYQTEIEGRMAVSPFSNEVKIIFRESSTYFPLYAKLGCAAVILLLLLVTVTCFLIAKRRKASCQNTESPVTFASGAVIQKNDSNMCLSSEPERNKLNSEEPGMVQEGITYATLNMEILSHNKGSLVPAAGSNLPFQKKQIGAPQSGYQDITYACVNVSGDRLQ
ncbi:uncharacterized protein LOC125487966 isoform X2 [Rhincodon typus]|nr:uncharacterized protein LOC125487966 isoform X2 [Rhincodon typus]